MQDDILLKLAHAIYTELYSLIFFNVQGGACQFLIDNDKLDHYI